MGINIGRFFKFITREVLPVAATVYVLSSDVEADVREFCAKNDYDPNVVIPFVQEVLQKVTSK